MTKVMLITGASRGIGAATARLAAGAAMTSRSTTPAAKLQPKRSSPTSAPQGAEALAIQADVGKPEEVARLFKTVDAEFGRLDAFFNNAGILGTASKFVDIAPDRLQRIIAVNTVGAFIAAQEAARRMSTRLGGKGGVIVNMSSLAAKLGGTNEATDYAASKGAIDTLTIGLAKEVAAEGIRVHAVQARPDRYRHPREHRRSRSRRALQRYDPHAAGRQARGGGGSGAVALLGPVLLLHRAAARHLRRARAVTATRGHSAISRQSRTGLGRV